MRSNEVLLSDEEHARLTNLKEESYEPHTPFGHIVGDLIEKVDE